MGCSSDLQSFSLSSVESRVGYISKLNHQLFTGGAKFQRKYLSYFAHFTYTGNNETKT